MPGTAGLSVLARLMRQGRFEEFETGETGPRSSPRMPAQRGFTRGTLGAQGSGFLRSRNSDAAIEEDRKTIHELLLGNR